jgi:hypothetical protein
MTATSASVPWSKLKWRQDPAEHCTMKHSLTTTQLGDKFIFLSSTSHSLNSSCLGDRLGGVVVNVLVTGPKSCGFEPGQCYGF